MYITSTPINIYVYSINSITNINIRLDPNSHPSHRHQQGNSFTLGANVMLDFDVIFDRKQSATRVGFSIDNFMNALQKDITTVLK